MAFHEIRFPENISYGAKSNINFSTDITTLASGHEQRNNNWQNARMSFDINYPALNPDDLAQIIAFFRARNGKTHGFRFKDWCDYQAVQSLIATANGSQTAFQLKKIYNNSTFQYERTIHKIVAGSVKIYFGATLQTTGYTINNDTGVITFASPPANSTQIKADFEFDVPVRFDADSLSISLHTKNEAIAENIRLAEIRI